MRSPFAEAAAFAGYHGDIDWDERVISTSSIILMFFSVTTFCGERNLRLVLILLLANPADGIPKEYF
jgi:hypothetical protein